MVSPPESSEDNEGDDNNTPKDNDIFQTPPEGSPIASSNHHRDDCAVCVEEETAGACTEGDKAVDLGADTDLGFSEVELTQRFDSVNEVIYSESTEVTVLKRELAFSESLSESQLKKPKISDENLCTQSPNRCLGESINSLRKSVEKSICDKDGPYNYRYISPQSNQNSDASGESSAKRKLEFLGEVLHSENEASHISEGFLYTIRNSDRSGCSNDNGKGSLNSGRKSIEDIDKYRYIGPSDRNSSDMERTQAIRALPVSICPPVEKDSGNDCGEITLLDVLRMLTRNCDYDCSLESKSILDVAKSRGLTFP